MWFECLLFYGCDVKDADKEDADVALLPSLVEKVVLPKLTGMFVLCVAAICSKPVRQQSIVWLFHIFFLVGNFFPFMNLTVMSDDEVIQHC